MNTLVSLSLMRVDVTRLVSFTDVRCRRSGSPVLRKYVITVISAFVVEHFGSSCFISCVCAFRSKAFSKLACALPDRTFYAFTCTGVVRLKLSRLVR